MDNTDRVWSIVEGLGDEFLGLSDRIWGMPELAFGEFRSSAEHAAVLDDHGFAVTRELAGLPTALMAEAGEGGPTIAFLGEYDALPGLAQEAGVVHEQRLAGGDTGHGCGHNMLGTAALLAATAVKRWLAEEGLPGTVRYYGCPAEEGGGGKVFMVRGGAFDGCDAALTWHPSTTTRVDPAMALANVRIDFRFTGRASHAAAAPHLGRSALDAVELMNVGANYMREHMPSDARIHYAVLDTGGHAANVVQATALVRYAVRARTMGELDELLARVRKVADGAALMTETSVESRIVSAYSDMMPNPPLREVVHGAMSRLGPVPFDDDDRAFAADIQSTFMPAHILGDYREIGREDAEPTPLFEEIVPLDARVRQRMSSTDVADVSHVVPTVECQVATWAVGTQPHTWQVVAQGKSGSAHKGLLHAAKVMASAACDLLRDASLVEAVADDHRRRREARPYHCPIPDDVQPPIQRPDEPRG